MDQKRYTDSAAATQKALELNDKDWRVWSNLQLAYVWLKDDEKSRAARAKTLALLEQYVSANPKDAAAQSMLGILYAEDKLRDKAITHANSALAIAPQDPVVLADIAEVYEDLGDRKRAILFAGNSLRYGSTDIDLQQRPALQSLLADPAFRPIDKK